MLSLSSSQSEPSALLSNARLTIATLIQRPSTITTSNAFEEFAILDQLIDVSNDVDRFEGGESRKFLNIAQLITASTCIYSRRVDALYKLINAFQSSSTLQDQSDASLSGDDEQAESVVQPEQEQGPPRKPPPEKKKKNKENNRSFLCQDLSKISLNPSKNFFLDRTSLFDLKLFQSYVPVGNKQFWINDNQPMIFDLLFDHELLEVKNEPVDDYDGQPPQPLVDALNNLPPVASFDINDIPLPISADDDDDEPSWDDESHMIDQVVQRKIFARTRTKRAKQDIDLNLFRHGLSDRQQALFRCQKIKSVPHKLKVEPEHFFDKKFNRKHFDGLIKDWPPSIVSIFVYPTITIQHFTIRERYAMKIDHSLFRSIRSPPMPISDVLDENALVPLSPLPSFTFTYDTNDDAQEDFDVQLQTNMEQFLDAAIGQSNEEQEHNKIFLELRSTIVSYMNEHEAVQTIDTHDLVTSLNDKYSLPLVFSQLLHLCASTQRYHLRSTSDDSLLIEKTRMDKSK